MVGPAAVEEEAEAVDGEQIAKGTFPVRPAQRHHLHGRPHPFVVGGRRRRRRVEPEVQAGLRLKGAARSEERRVGKECRN